MTTRGFGCVAVAVFLCALGARPAWADFTLVEGGQAKAVIVTPDDPNPAVQDAVKHFQAIVKQMTGAELAVVAEGAYDGSTPPVFIGQSMLVKQKGVDVEQNREDGDHYVVRATDDFLALIGNDDLWMLGSNYAAFDLLQRLGCGWFGPDTVWHVVPKSQTLTVPALNVEERPDYQMRSIWMVKDDLMRRAWRMGGIDVPASHNLERLVPPHELKEAHPDWFGPGQPCLTNPEVKAHVIGVLRKQLEESNRPVTRLSISPNDNEDFCRCPECRAAGNVSARMIKFANAVADGLRETHEGRFRLMFLAYWVMHSPPTPMVQGPPELDVMMVNEGDRAHPVSVLVPNYDPGRNNRREQQNMAGWLKTGNLTALYEWWIPGCSNENWRSVPWYSGETALENLRYWRERGIQYITYETQYEHGDGFPIRWPLYYTAARGTWDTSVRADDVMREACVKLYGSAAEPMFQFYHTLEMAMANTEHAGRNWHLPSPELIYSVQTEDEATKYLDAAAQATDDAEALARIASERKMWTQARQTLAKLRHQASGAEAFAVTLDGATMQWRNPMVTGQTVRDLFGVNADVPLSVIEADNQTRPLVADATYDLRANITFRKEAQ